MHYSNELICDYIADDKSVSIPADVTNKDEKQRQHDNEFQHYDNFWNYAMLLVNIKNIKKCMKLYVVYYTCPNTF